ncbi:MAG: hypothetical protein ACUVT0_11445 [Thermochromatium sp.]
MLEWGLSLVVLILGLIGLVLGVGGVQRAVESLMMQGLDSRCAPVPWPALVALLPALAVIVQVVGAGASALGLGAIVGIHVIGVVWAIGQGLSWDATGCWSSLLGPTPLPPGEGDSNRPIGGWRSWGLVGAAGLVWALALDGRLGQGDGAVLVWLCLSYVISITRTRRPLSSPVFSADTHTPSVAAGYRMRSAHSWWRPWGPIAQVCVGLTLLAMGARVLTMGVLDLARVLKVDDWALGLMLVAPLGILAGWAPILTAQTRLPARVSLAGWPGLWFDFTLVNLLGVVGVVALAAPGGVTVTGQMLWLSWPVVILTSLLARAALIRTASPA